MSARSVFPRARRRAQHQRYSCPSKNCDEREKLEQILRSSAIGLFERNSIREFLDKNDLVTDTAKKLLAISRESEVLPSKDSLSNLTETVYLAQGQLDAESIHLFLESYGFPNRVLQESAGVVLALTVGSLGEAEIRVTLEDAEQARIYIQAMKSGVFMLSELEELHLQSVFPDDVEGDIIDLSDDF